MAVLGLGKTTPPSNPLLCSAASWGTVDRLLELGSYYDQKPAAAATAVFDAAVPRLVGHLRSGTAGPC